MISPPLASVFFPTLDEIPDRLNAFVEHTVALDAADLYDLFSFLGDGVIWFARKHS